MPTQQYPGVYVAERATDERGIVGSPTSIAAFVGATSDGPAEAPTLCNSLGEFERLFGGFVADLPLGAAVRDFYANGGEQALVVRVQPADGSALSDDDLLGDPALKTGLHALAKADLFNLLCVPPKRRGERTSVVVYRRALSICVERRAMLIVDPDPAWAATPQNAVANVIAGRAELAFAGEDSRNAALYFPCLLQPDPLRSNHVDAFPPCGAVAGVFARVDAQRGVWTAPAGLDAVLRGGGGLQMALSERDNAQLNRMGVNCLRSFPASGDVIWGARTLRGADETPDEFKYVPVRRVALFIEESLHRGLQWAVFEPNGEPLWAQIRQSISAFMHRLFRQGAFQGRAPNEAWFVKCDATTTTQTDIAEGVVNVLVGFAPLKPAEFVVLKIRQAAGRRREPSHDDGR